MPVPFGFSVGDVIAGIGALVTAYDAIKGSGGAASEYQQHIIWLNQLIEVLEKLRLETDDTVPQLAEECKAILLAFKETIKAKYKTHLGAGGKKGKWLARRFRQLQWAFLRDAENDLVKLRNDIQPQLTAIGLYLDVQVKSAVGNVQKTTDKSLTAVEALSNAVDRGFHDVRKLLEALPRQIAAEASTTDSVQNSTARSAIILTETRTVVEETRERHEQIKSAAPYLLQRTQFGDLSKPPPFISVCMNQAMREDLKEHQEQLSDQEESGSTSNPTMRADLAFRTVSFPLPVPSILPVSQTISDYAIVSTLSNTSRPVNNHREPGIAMENERAKTFFSARQLNLWFGTLFTWTRTDIVDDDKPIYSSVRRITKTTYYFWPAKWFSMTGVFLISEIVYKAFRKPEVKHLWETYRVVPKDSPIIQACVDLDLPQIQCLFNERLASPFDRDERSSSLFDHCAAALRHPVKRSEIARITSKLLEIAEYLIPYGAELGQSTAPVRDCPSCVYTISGHFFGFSTTTFCHLLIHYYVWSQAKLIKLIRLIVDYSRTDPFDNPEVQRFLAASKKDWTKYGITELSSYTRNDSLECVKGFQRVLLGLKYRGIVVTIHRPDPDFVDVQDIHELIKTMSDLYELRKNLTINGSRPEKILWLLELMQGRKVWTQQGMRLATRLADDHGFSDLWSNILSHSRFAVEDQVYKQWNGVQFIKLPHGYPHKLKQRRERRMGRIRCGPERMFQIPGAYPLKYRLWQRCCSDH